MQTPAPLIARHEFRPSTYPQVLRQTILIHGNTHVERDKPATLGAQNLTALGAATIDQSATCAGAHAMAETVLHVTTTVVRLECPLHN